MRKRKQILLVDDHPLIMDGLCALLRKEAGLFVCNRAGNGLQLLQLLPTCLPDLIVLDINMPEMDGITAARKVKASYPDVRILCLSSYFDKALMQTLRDIPVDGFVPKQLAGEHIVEAIHRVLAGEEVFIKSETENPFGKTGIAALEGLNEREREIIGLIKQGKTNDEIAALLFRSRDTVKSHRKTICTKLNISGQGSLLKFVAELDI